MQQRLGKLVVEQRLRGARARAVDVIEREALLPRENLRLPRDGVDRLPAALRRLE